MIAINRKMNIKMKKIVTGHLKLLFLASCCFTLCYYCATRTHSDEIENHKSYSDFHIGALEEDYLEHEEENKENIEEWFDSEELLSVMDNVEMPHTTHKPQNKKRSKKVILFTYMRGGSTFLGELFHQNKETVYWFEPLNGFYHTYFMIEMKTHPMQTHYFPNKKKREITNEEKERIAVFHDDLMNCKYAEIPLPVFFGSLNKSTIHVHKRLKNIYQNKKCNEILRRSCITNNQNKPRYVLHREGMATSVEHQCFQQIISAFDLKNSLNGSLQFDSRRFLSYAKCHDRSTTSYWREHKEDIQHCNNANIQVVKNIRLTMESVDSIMKRLTDVFLIYYVRDPRGILASRMSTMLLSFSNIDIESKVLCNKINLDLIILSSLKKKYDKRIVEFKYENFAVHPLVYAEKMYGFIGEKLPKSLVDWIHMATTGKGSNLKHKFSTHRSNSSAGVDSWKKKLKGRSLQIVTKNCLNVLKKLKYVV